MDNNPNQAVPVPPIEKRVDEVLRRAKEVLEDVERKSEHVRGLVIAARAVVMHADKVQFCSICGRYSFHGQNCPIEELKRKLAPFQATR
jgi:hypothetical protein